MTFPPTKDCPKFPAHLNPKTLPKPCKELSDEDIDWAIRSMIEAGPPRQTIPRTQYGRRVMVEHFLSLERKAIIAGTDEFIHSYQPSQPR